MPGSKLSTYHLEILVEASRIFAQATANHTKTIETIGQFIAQSIAETCAIWVTGPDRKHLAQPTIFGRAQSNPLPPKAQELAERAFKDNAPQRDDFSQIVPLRSRGEGLGVIGFFSSVDAEVLNLELADRAALAIDNARLFGEVLAARRRAEVQKEHSLLLADVSRLFFEAKDPQDALIQLCGILVPRFADGCLIDLINPDGQLGRHGCAHFIPEKQNLLDEVAKRFPAQTEGENPLRQVFESRRSVRFSTFSHETLERMNRGEEFNEIMREIGFRHTILVPLAAHGTTLGVLTLLITDSDREYTEEDQEFAEKLGVRASFAAENARLYQKLAASETRYRSLFEQAPFAIQIFDPDGNWREANSGWERLWDTERENLKGYNLLKDPQAADLGLIPEFKRAFAGEALQIEPKLYDPAKIGKPGRPRWIHFRLYPLKDESNRVQEVVLVLEDVTDRKTTDEELSRSRDHLDAILHGVTDGITVMDRTGKMIFANGPGAKMCGFESTEELIRTPLHKLMDRFELFDDLRNPFPLEMLPSRRALRGERSIPETLVRFRYKKSTEDRWSLINATPVFNEKGEVIFAINIFRDFTAHKSAEVTLRSIAESNSFLSQASETLGSSLDYESTIASVTRLAVPGFADWCAADLLSDNGELHRLAVAHRDPKKVEWAYELHRKFPPDPRAPHGTYEILRTGKSQMVSVIPPTMIEESIKDPEHLHMIRQIGLHSYIGIPLTARNKTLGVLTFILSEANRSFTQDDLRLAEELGRRAAMAIDNARLYQVAQSAIQVRDEFISICSHELKTPVTSLKLQSQVIARQLENKLESPSPVKLKKFIDTSNRQLDRLIRLIEDMLDVSRISTGRLSLEMEDLDLCDLTREVLDRFGEQFRQAGIALEINDENSVRIRGDRYRLEQVVTNLVTNALKYGNNKPIRISVQKTEDYARLQVSDQGLGIAQESQARIFNRFERAISSNQISGLGLGLYITKQIVESHGGTISVESEPKKGSTFTVVLPSLSSPKFLR